MIPSAAAHLDGDADFIFQQGLASAQTTEVLKMEISIFLLV